MKLKTKKPLSPYILIAVVLAAILWNIFLFVKPQSSCDVIDTLPASVQVKYSDGRNHIGFDLNKYNLTFGTLSPGAMANRKVYAEYTKNANTYIWTEGNISTWVIISPKKFEIEPRQKKEVSFTLLVPSTAREGEYAGRVVFCYQDK